jgi:Fe-Mn family superoxide dismutase
MFPPSIARRAHVFYESFAVFWENLAPTGKSSRPSGHLEACIINCFGSVDAMKSELSAKSIAIQGSGWGWLGYNTATGGYNL